MICKTSDQRDLYYEVKGNVARSKTLVFLNGLTQNTTSWYLVEQHFKNDYKIILLDFIFQGQSSKEGEWRDFDQHARDLKAVLDLENEKSPVIIGLSYGSVVAQHFAVQFPQRLSKLVLISTFAHHTPYFEALGLSWWRALEIGGYNLMLDVMLPNVLSESYFANPIIPIDAIKEARKEMHQNTDAIFKLMHATKERKDFREERKKIKAPVLIIQGEKDLLISVSMAKEVHLNIPDSKFSIIKNAGHTLNLEYVPEVCTLIKDFLNEQAQ
jgi:3-oxoadipate enol-lactonase